MTEDLRRSLAHVLWIGGGTDAGKSTAARWLAERRGLLVYPYDRTDAAHIERLAETHPEYRAFLAASLDERWVDPEPQALVERALRAFRDRFPLVIEDLLGMPREPGIVAEGFGLLPELVAPLLERPEQALWLVPGEAFKEASMERRGKPSFAAQTRDPERARRNLLERDRRLAELIREQAQACGVTVWEVEMGEAIEGYFYRPGCQRDGGWDSRVFPVDR